MANAILNILGPSQLRPAAEFSSQQVAQKDGYSFSAYVEQKCGELNREGKNLLGVKPHDVGKTLQTEKKLPGLEGHLARTVPSEDLQQLLFKLKVFAEKEGLDPAEVETLKNMLVAESQNLSKAAPPENGLDLSGEQMEPAVGSDNIHQLLLKLKNFAYDDNKAGAGEWPQPAMGISSLEKLAAEAGLSPDEVDILKNIFEASPREFNRAKVSQIIFNAPEDQAGAMGSQRIQRLLLKLREFAQKNNIGFGELHLTAMKPSELENLAVKAKLGPAESATLKEIFMGTPEVDSETIISAKSPEGSDVQVVPINVERIQQVLARLKEFAQDNSDTGAGQWQISLLDFTTLRSLAESAGMDSTQFETMLHQTMEEQNGSVKLLEFITVLERHFSQINDEHPVTAPETSLPLLQTILEKMGISAEKVEQISESSVNDLGKFDLAIFLEGLQRIDSEGEMSQIPLSDWQTEQLRNMLAEAGLSKDMLKEYFPKDPAILTAALEHLTGKHIESPENTEFSSKISLDQLKEMLNQTIADAESAAPKADIPAFLYQLENILKQAGFKNEGVGFTPVIQGTVAAIFQELQKIIDQARIRIDNVADTAVQDAELVNEWLASGTTAESEKSANQVFAATGVKVIEQLVEKNEIANPFIGNKEQTDSSLGHVNQAGSDGKVNGAETAELKFVHPRLHLSPDMQSFTLDQIAQTVLRGLKNTQHHLTLTLYPKELGEVKVDMLVKNNQVTLSFLMENPKVKELMEGNMQEFRNNLEQRGFVIGGCNVSVDHNNNGGDHQKQFELAKIRQDANKSRTTLTEISERLAAGQTGQSYHNGVINMMV